MKAFIFVPFLLLYDKTLFMNLYTVNLYMHAISFACMQRIGCAKWLYCVNFLLNSKQQTEKPILMKTKCKCMLSDKLIQRVI